MVGGEFARHGTGEFSTEIVQPSHPIMQGLTPFTTWDETYVHKNHNPTDRTVLMERVDQEGREPWTWVRTQGKGRVFYTAYGHDQRTWSHPSFQKLVEQGTVWAVPEAARQAWQGLQMPEVTYVDGFNVPNYENRSPAPKYQMPFNSRDAMKFVTTPAEFEVTLFAEEPMIAKPITFAFDERGRLWLIDAADYPNRVLHGQPGDDRIKILEDTNGDGRADKVTVFADKINLASSLVFANGGVIVAAAPHMLFLKDTNGDDKADERTVLSTGWGVRDSHAGPSNLQYGPDNFVWGVVGYSGYEGEMNGARQQFLQGVYRFKPNGEAFEFLTGSTNNTWGLGFSETFDVFGSTANNEPSFHMAIPNRYFDGAPGLVATRAVSGPGYQSIQQFYAAHYLTPYIRQVDVFGGYTAAAGHHLYTARAFPKKYWNRIAFISEPTAHIVGQGIVEKQGAGFVTRDGWNLMAGAEEWFSPVHAQAGPDGAVWVADWYNFINQHNPTPPGHSNGAGNAYETSMRDRTRGRIYRVAWREAKPAPKLSLSKSAPDALIAALASDNMFWRLHAQRLLVERGQRDVVPKLVALARQTKVDEIGINGGAQHALWTLHGLGAMANGASEGTQAAIDALSNPAAGVRKAAAMVLPREAASADRILAAGLLRDPDLQTRLAVVLTLADMPASPAIAKALYDASRDPVNFGDRWLSRAIYLAAYRHREAFLTTYRADPGRLEMEKLPLALRLGSDRPDWRLPERAAVASEWKDMETPGSWESKGLPGFDGVVWFTREIEAPAAAGALTRLSLGRVASTADIWVNGQALAAAPPGPPPVPPARPAPPIYEVPAGALRAGSNTITLRVQNLRGDGGFLSEAAAMYLQSGESRTPLSGVWKYRVERQTNAAALYGQPGELAAHLALSTLKATAQLGAATGATARQAVPDVVLRLNVIPDQLKWDRVELAAAPGQLIELTINNADVMPHNFLLGASGSLEAIGAASDAMLTDPKAASLNYVPDVAAVLYSTPLIAPGQTLTVQFRAPSQPGRYPYVCTFPGHWRLMNGVLQVRATASSR
jgi:putative membrane-bound dehydrogenase-like protein